MDTPWKWTRHGFSHIHTSIAEEQGNVPRPVCPAFWADTLNKPYEKNKSYKNKSYKMSHTLYHEAIITFKIWLSELKYSYYVTSSMSGQDVLNVMLWLATRAGKMELNTLKKNLANIQPSWPHAWSITHTWKLWQFCSWWATSTNTHTFLC